MNYRGPGILAVVQYDLAPSPSPPLSYVSKLSLFLSLPVCPQSSLGEGGRKREGAKAYDGEKGTLLFKQCINNSLTIRMISLTTDSRRLIFTIRNFCVIKKAPINA
jgi:hypothetical protein